MWKYIVYFHPMQRLITCHLLIVASISSDSLAAAVRPSFVFLLSESLDGRLLRPDSLAKIPNIRALLAGGSVRFDSAYSNSPVCAPSRSSMHSGRAPHKIAHQHNGMTVNGVWNNYEGLPINYSSRLDQLLNASGYAVSIEGKTDWTVGGHSLEDRLEGITFNVRWPYNITSDGGGIRSMGARCARPTDPCSRAGAQVLRGPHSSTTGAS